MQRRLLGLVALSGVAPALVVLAALTGVAATVFLI
jgi:hypothetical protein